MKTDIHFAYISLWDCGGTVVKVLFDSRWCHWNFSLT